IVNYSKLILFALNILNINPVYTHQQTKHLFHLQQWSNSKLINFAISCNETDMADSSMSVPF
ncbi:hypothetical protein, partial [Bacillus mycoides]|uniref:hypothetical protein n=1 Tax=Bacillus mycoides TaxID=1405 RepID=UPI0019D5C792